MSTKLKWILAILTLLFIAGAAWRYLTRLPKLLITSIDSQKKLVYFSFDGKNYQYDFSAGLSMTLQPVRGYTLLVSKLTAKNPSGKPAFIDFVLTRSGKADGEPYWIDSVKPTSNVPLPLNITDDV